MESLTDTLKNCRQFTMEELLNTTLRELVLASMALDPSINDTLVNDVSRRLCDWANENKVTNGQMTVALLAILATGTVEGMQMIKDRTGASQAT